MEARSVKDKMGSHWFALHKIDHLEGASVRDVRRGGGKVEGSKDALCAFASNAGVSATGGREDGLKPWKPTGGEGVGSVTV